VLLGLLVALGVRPTPWLALLPLVIGLQFLLLLGLSLGVAALSVRYRDTIQLVQALLPLWFFLTPVVYPVQAVPAGWAWLLQLNPLAHLARAWQALLYEGRPPEPLGLLAALGFALGALVAGAAVFEALRERIPEEL
jgi:ABC-type polysaccharide/polyol phosphate export permease